MERISVYVDGFNLYFGIKASGWRDLLWLDLDRLSTNLLKRGQKLVCTKYFTARISGPEDKRIRQQSYLEALATLPSLQVIYGKYQLSERTCPKCGFVVQVSSEKMTDVNIAVELLADAYADVYDTAILVSADNDLRASVETVRRVFKDKRVVMGFPPRRSSFRMQKVANAHFTIGRANLRRSQFPETVTSKSGYVIKRPSQWR